MSTENNTFALRVRKARRDANITQAQLAERIGVSLGAVAAYEVGRNLPQADNIAKIAEALGVGQGWLLGGENSNDQTRLSPELALFLDEVNKTSSRAGVAAVELLERLYQEHGLETAVKMKKEREAATQADQKVGLASPVPAGKTVPSPETVPKAAETLIRVGVAKAKKPTVGI